MPVYNHEGCVAEAIQSVLDQSYGDFEFIITDDGSTDGTVREIEKFADPRISFFRFAENKGASVAMNHCLEKAGGVYIAIMNADDVFLPNKLEKQVKFLDEHDDVGGVFSHVSVINGHGNKLTGSEHFDYNHFNKENRSRYQWLNFFFCHGNVLCHPTLLIRKECYEDVGYYNEMYAQAPDYDMWIRLCMKYDIHVIQEQLAKYRVLEGKKNMSADRPEVRIRTAWELTHIFKNFLKVSGLDELTKIFPDIAGKYEKLHEDLIPFYIAMFALDKNMHHVFAMNVLSELLSDPVKAKKIEELHKFSYLDLIDITGAHKINLSQALHAKVYVDNGDGISEARSITKLISGREDHIEFDLADYEGIKKLRFDPIDSFAVLDIGRIEVVDEKGDSHIVSDYKSNVFCSEGNRLMFDTSDPQIFDIDLSHVVRPKKILIDLDFVAIGIEALDYILPHRTKCVEKFNQVIEEKEERIGLFDQIIKAKDQTIGSLDRVVGEKKEELVKLAEVVQGKDAELGEIRQVGQGKDAELGEIRQVVQGKDAELGEVRQVVEQRDQGIVDLKSEIGKHHEHISHLDGVVAEKDIVLHDKLNEIKAIRSSLVWRLSWPIRKFVPACRWLLSKLFGRLWARLSLLKVGVKCLKDEGLSATWRKTRNYFKGESQGQGLPDILSSPPVPIDDNTWRYMEWRRVNYLHDGDFEKMKKEAEGWKMRPKFSILMPVYNTDEIYLRRALASVLNQIYGDWELCVIDDCSTAKIVRPILKEYVEKDDRIKVKYLENNKGVAGAFNEAYEMATADYIVLLNSDDEISKHALWANAKRINERPNVDFIYSDHDKVDVIGRHFRPAFKPDWSPELILSYNYTGHLRVFSKQIIEKVGFFREECEPGHDYDLILRLTEATDEIQHIPDVLYHWRATVGSVALGDTFNSQRWASGRLVLDEYLDRNKIEAEVELPSFAKRQHVSLYNLKFKDCFEDKISIIISTRNVDLLSVCIDSILKKTTYSNYEIIIVYTAEGEPEILKKYKKRKNIKVMTIIKDKFSFATVNNEAAKEAEGKYLVLLNDDTEVLTPDWLQQMRGTFALSSGVGAVGVKLLYNDDTIQHAGVLLGIYRTADHAFRRMSKDEVGYMCMSDVMRNYSACTAACLMVKKSVFDEVGGFDEKLALAYNDVDLCLKFMGKGYRTVYNPNVVFYHYEMATRTVGEYSGESNYLRKKWGDKLLDNDPYYNINLSKRHHTFLIKETDETETYTG
ncbi:glycosyltransferase [Candidatus Peregrinibacteria bacterium]|nr:glycosyltransferase [Candidatus Peregrinibacteria bacterium]